MSAFGPIGAEVWVHGWSITVMAASRSPGRSRRSSARSKRLARRTVAASLALASAFIAVGGYSSSAAPASASGVAVSNCLKGLACYTPQQFRVAYGIQPLLDRGIDGRGETVVLLEQEVTTPAAPPKVTDIRQDLARFDGLFGLPAPRLQVENSLARSPSPWLADVEEVEDTEIVHAVAPEADIREIVVSDSDAESPAATVKYGLAALRLGVTQGAVISVSSSKGESCFTPAEIEEQNATLQTAREHHVTVVISSEILEWSASRARGRRLVRPRSPG